MQLTCVRLSTRCQGVSIVKETAGSGVFVCWFVCILYMWFIAKFILQVQDFPSGDKMCPGLQRQMAQECLCVYGSKKCNLPVQVLPSGDKVYPGSQRQLKEPWMFSQICMQPPLLFSHSLMSRKQLVNATITCLLDRYCICR